MAYPILGILFFIRHPVLWRDALCPFALLLVCSGAVAVAALFIGFPLLATTLVKYAHLPPAAAWIIAFLVALVVIAVVSLVLFAALPPAYLLNAFCRTLQLRGCYSGQLLHNKRNRITGKCARLCSACFRVSVFRRILVGVGTLPINAVPLLGQGIWCWLNGVVLLWEHHAVWFDLYGLDNDAQKAWIAAHKPAYTFNGAIAQALEMVPLFNWFFCWTNAVGAALMVADWELKNVAPGPVPHAPADAGLGPSSLASSSTLDRTHETLVAPGDAPPNYATLPPSITTTTTTIRPVR
ncbi:hypothetical protein RI367_004922 [Sorochytrium milnesiophthora]